MGTYDQFTGKKASFEELAKAQDQNLHNSNMLNLVSATRTIDEELEWLDKRKAQLEAIRVEIVDFANSGDVSDTDKVRELHSKGSIGREFQRKRY